MTNTDRGEASHPSAMGAIGHTPLIELKNIPEDYGRVLAKLEYLNPGGSKKDRIARQMILDAERSGALKPGQTVIELTSGNTGAGLAVVCTITGHPFVAVMSKGNSEERAVMMRALGADVVLVDQHPSSPRGQVTGADLDLVDRAARRLVQERGAFRADQFELPANWRAHYLGTGPEILSAAGSFDAFCDFAGTGGSFAGCSKCFKEHNPAIRCSLVEPVSCAVLGGHPIQDPRHRIQGGGYSRAHLKMLEFANVSPDGYLTVSDEEAIAFARRLGREEGLCVGISSGANLAAAMKLLAGPRRGQTIVILLNDTGLKYLSTDLYSNLRGGS